MRSSASASVSMIPNPEFQNLPKSFWAAVRSIGQHCGYTKRGAISVPSLADMRAAYGALTLEPATLDLPLVRSRSVGELLHDYFTHRATMLMEEAKPALMDAAE